MDASTGVRCDRLQCRWLGWEPVKDDGLVLRVPEWNAPDMSGTIDIAKAVMPSVRMVTVMVGDRPDIRYGRRHDDTWWSERARPTP